MELDCGVWLSLGGFHERGRDWPTTQRIYNCHALLDPAGHLVAAYRKTHLCDVELEGRVTMKESSFTNPGTEIVPPVSTPAGKLGLSICYDLRFPEISLALRRAGAEILTYPSAFTVPTGSAHWEVLLRARAIESQCYVVAAAQTGKNHERRTSYGHALVVDPWGAVVAQCREGPGLCYAEIDLDYLHRIRQEIPVHGHRRPGLTSMAGWRRLQGWQRCREPLAGTVKSRAGPRPLCFRPFLPKTQQQDALRAPPSPCAAARRVSPLFFGVPPKPLHCCGGAGAEGRSQALQ
ncbi:PREDICTED: nitrilase homolog 1 [Aptenodytes forsteri]|uniref:nitrilase homolog 1 n=1 Tax=Aptenodytes forsteri TaxID=9233 RepID=UPI000905BB30|nr:PREDICTED: nitrilase homolog 1 [Aptenodytes forsteri]